METQKSSKFNYLESNRKVFLQIGFIIALAIVLVAFEWQTTGKNAFALDKAAMPANFDQEIAVITVQKEKPPPPKKKQEFEVVEDEKEVDDVVVIDVETSMSEKVDSFAHIPEYEEPEVKDDIDNKIYGVPQDEPCFPGGLPKLYQYLRNHINYPSQAHELNVQGKVFVSFVVEKDGSISNIEIQRGLGHGCDKEAIRVISNMPKWKPGRQMNIPVRTSFQLPISFILEAN